MDHSLDDSHILQAVRDDFLDFTATLIQSSYRGYQLRKSYNVLKRQSKALQNAWRTRDEAKITRELAATILQRQWRSYTGRKTMAYYKHLIAIHEQNDPREILRMINPREAEMMDAAAGLHLRFRLGGERFPPRLLYKIFTHRPVTDICSFCPRNYNAQQISRSEVGHVTTQAPIFSTTRIAWAGPGGDGPGSDSAPVGWYNREENNQWRPIDGKVFGSGFLCSERKPHKPVFHFCSRERARQRQLHRKQLQRQWRLAMYRDGALEDHGLGEEKAGVEEDLMEWCGGLDFEQYAQEWRAVATTLGSEAFVYQDEPLPIAPPWISSI